MQEDQEADVELSGMITVINFYLNVEFHEVQQQPGARTEKNGGFFVNYLHLKEFENRIN